MTIPLRVGMLVIALILQRQIDRATTTTTTTTTTTDTDTDTNTNTTGHSVYHKPSILAYL
jgi:hypothetical protein